MLAWPEPIGGKTYEGKFATDITPGVCNSRCTRRGRGCKPASAGRNRSPFSFPVAAAARGRPQAFGPERGRSGRPLSSHRFAIRRSFLGSPESRPPALVLRSPAAARWIARLAGWQLRCTRALFEAAGRTGKAGQCRAQSEIGAASRKARSFRKTRRGREALGRPI